LTVRTGVATVYVMSVRFEMRVDDALMEGIDGARGNETRAAWIKRTLAAALDDPHPAGRHPGQADRGGEAEEGGLSVASRSGQTARASAPQRAPIEAAKAAHGIPGLKSAAELFAEQCQARADERRRIREGG
jgi:hypothetical protein